AGLPCPFLNPFPHPAKESAMPAFPDVQVGDPLRHEALAVFPLYGPGNGAAEYSLADEALAAGSVTVEEASEAGSVPTLVVTNQADALVLFLEGEELRGAKQNRVLNTSLLAAARARTPIPVSCVEQSRWRYVSPSFGHGGSHSSSKLRHVLKRSVSESAKAGRGPRSGPGPGSEEGGPPEGLPGAAPATAAMADTYEAHRHRLAEFQEHLKYAEGATGLAVAVGARVVCVDLFDKPSTCRKVWDRLLTGVVLDALEAGRTEDQAGADKVQEALAHLRAAAWQQTQP